ncbi:hypothetical protein [Haloferula sp.]|uniref:hypothetical protein n=1 Tax=Haloferula sp. TaxID=2497595 RepID=UPI003C796DC3
MKIHSTPLVLALSTALLACQRPSKDEDISADNKASGSSSALASQSGQAAKWAMPETMMRHIRKLEKDVSMLESSGEKDHAGLAVKIDGHTGQLISDCTMEGEGHDALHDWLMPFLQLNKDYASAPDTTAKAARFKEIQDSLTAFRERFE